MANENNNGGCIALVILGICALIVVPMFITYVGHSIRDIIKENPGAVFAVALIAGLFAFIYLKEGTSK